MWIFALIYLFLFLPYWALIAWYHRAWKAIPLFNPEKTGKPASTRISVLVPARNEADHAAVLEWDASQLP